MILIYFLCFIFQTTLYSMENNNNNIIKKEKTYPICQSIVSSQSTKNKKELILDYLNGDQEDPITLESLNEIIEKASKENRIAMLARIITDSGNTKNADYFDLHSLFKFFWQNDLKPEKHRYNTIHKTTKYPFHKNPANNLLITESIQLYKLTEDNNKKTFKYIGSDFILHNKKADTKEKELLIKEIRLNTPSEILKFSKNKDEVTKIFSLILNYGKEISEKNPKKGIEQYQRILNATPLDKNNNNFNETIPRTNLLIGLVYKNLLKQDQNAIPYLVEALKGENQQFKNKALIALSTIYLSTNTSEFEFYFKQIDLNTANNSNKVHIAKIYYKIALKEENDTLKQQYLLKAKEILNLCTESTNLSKQLLVKIEKEQKNFKTALNIASTIIQPSKNNDPKITIKTQGHMAEIYYEQKEIENASKLSFSIISSNEKTIPESTKAIAYKVLAQISYDQENYPTAELYAVEGLNCAPDKNKPAIHYLLGLICAEQKEKKLAKMHMEEAAKQNYNQKIKKAAEQWLKQQENNNNF